MRKDKGNMKRTPLRKVSKKRSSQMSRYSKLKKAYMEEFPVCEVCKHLSSVDIHHRKGRDGDRLNHTIFWLAVCRLCHDTIHANPIWATKYGYTISRLTK